RPQGAGCDIGAFEFVPATTTITVTASPSPSLVGQSVTFTATVAVIAPATGTPTGTVAFNDVATPINTATLNGAGVATISTSGLAAGDQPITASYSGDPAFAAGTPTTSVQSVLVDSDGDGIPDVNDGCPNDPKKTSPGACGCGKPETEANGNGVPDCIDP